MNNVQEIERRFTQILLDTGKVTHVTIQHAESRHDIHLTPATDAMVDERLLRLLLEWTGNRPRASWSPRPYENPLFVEEASSEHITVSVHGVNWTGNTIGQHETLAQLLVLALSFIPAGSGGFDLLHLYTAKEEVEKAYRAWATRVLSHEQDSFSSSCDRMLRPYWLCCPEHRTLLLERMNLRDWLIAYNRNWNPRYDYHEDGYTSYMTHEPSATAIRDSLTRMSYDSPQAYLDAYFTFTQESKHYGWHRPTRSCTWKEHEQGRCCQTHVALCLQRRMLDAWAQYYNDLLDLSHTHCTRGGFFDPIHISLFLRAARIDPSDLQLPRWYHSIVTDEARKERR